MPSLEREAGGDGGEAPGDDPEDDLETAFGVLDQAKVIYQKQVEGDGVDAAARDETRLKLAEAHDALGEVLTESGGGRRLIVWLPCTRGR